MGKTLFDETDLCGIRLKNRLFRSATWLGLCHEDGRPETWLYGIYEELVAGGVGAVVTEITDVAEFDHAMHDNLRLCSDACIPHHERLVGVIHEGGAAAISQLVLDKFKREGEAGAVPVGDLTSGDITEAARLFADAAARAEACGYDAVQLHIAYGWLLQRSMNPRFNRNAGGDPARLAALACEVTAAVKARVGVPVCAKLGFRAAGPMRYAADECAEACRLLEAAGLDFVEVVGDHGPAERAGGLASCYLPLARAVRERCAMPIVLTGANVDPEVMERILDEDGIEYFGLSRPLIAEPGLPARWRRGSLAPSRCRRCDACYETYGKRCAHSGKA